jgi:hypothetical protein
MEKFFLTTKIIHNSMETNQKFNVYNILSFVVATICLVGLGYVFYVVTVPTRPDSVDNLFYTFFTVFGILPVSSLVFAVFISKLPAEPKLQLFLSYLMCGIFFAAYLYVRVVNPMVNGEWGQVSGLGIFDYFLWICALAFLIPIVFARRRVKNIEA